MKTHRYIVTVFCTVIMTLGGSPCLAQARLKTVLVHYMPWYASKPISGYWGWHWTMNHFNPDNVKNNGEREIASYEYPLIGPYDSSDPHALECHVLLMKLAGIDGVIIDWYGTEKFRDYAEIHHNTQRLINHVKRAGLQFAICYEDQSIKHMIEEKHLSKQDDIAEGEKSLRWLADNWFQDDAYVKMNGQPVLLVFGPQYFGKEEWAQIVSDLPHQQPWLYGLPHLWQDAGMDGAFGWLPVNGGRKVSPDVWTEYLHSLHAHNAARESVISVVFPGYRDIYRESGLHDSYGFIDERGGKTFDETLTLALESDVQLIQIATWNDYGEGTVIEPTRKSGYRYLKIVQKHTTAHLRFVPDDLRLPVMLYQLKKRHSQNESIMKNLQIATDLLFAGKCDKARTILEAISKDY